MLYSILVTGRIDEIQMDGNSPECLSNARLLKQYAFDTWGSYGDADQYLGMYAPLRLSEGEYAVFGIEGQFYNGYNDPNEQSWPMQVLDIMSAFDLMILAAGSKANGYPDSNHVWFERIEIDCNNRTIKFSMGS